MDQSDSEEELFPIENPFASSEAFDYNDVLLFTGLLRAVSEESLEKVQNLVKAGKSININDNLGNTPLHLAVFNSGVEILDYLLNHEEVIINSRNFVGQTPLSLAVTFRKYGAVKKLLEAGANVNLPNFEDITPLHNSVGDPTIAHLLIKHNAQLDVADYSGDAPIHDAISQGYLEVTSMLLYYNCDANAVGGNNLTPFMKALIGEFHDIQDLLLEYVSDFNVCTSDNMSTLELAIVSQSRHIKEIIRRGAKVRLQALEFCPENLEIFKMIWDRLKTTDETLPILAHYSDRPLFEDYINHIIESENVDLFLNTFRPNFCENIIASVEEDQLAKIIFRLLEMSGELHSCDICTIFHRYGYSELLRQLCYMDYHGLWPATAVTPRIIFDVQSRIKNVLISILRSTEVNSNNLILKRDLEICSGYSQSADFSYMYTSIFRNGEKMDFPVFPTLSELARNKSREFILKYFNVQNNCQYYTVIDHLNISNHLKKILKFEKKLYHRTFADVTH